MGKRSAEAAGRYPRVPGDWMHFGDHCFPTVVDTFMGTLILPGQEDRGKNSRKEAGDWPGGTGMRCFWIWDLRCHLSCDDFWQYLPPDGSLQALEGLVDSTASYVRICSAGAVFIWLWHIM